MSSKVFLYSVMLFSNISVVSAGSFNLVGNGSCSPDCALVIRQDDRSNVEENCNNGGFYHLLNPSVSGLISGRGRENVEGGYGEIEATFYPQSGRLSAKTRAVAQSKLDGVHAAGFIVGLDQQGQAIFESQRFDIPTACATMDPTCRTTTAVGSFEQQVNPVIAKFVTRLEVHVTSHNSGCYTSVKGNAYNNLPPEVKAAIKAAFDLP